MPRNTILIVAGGTGGHVYPALAVARYLHDRGVPLFWMGTLKGLEARVAPANGYTLLTINITGVRGKGLRSWLSAPLRLTVAVIQALRIIRHCRPGAVLGMGGFVSAPGGVAAWLLGVPLLIHEQNAVAGFSNRLLARLARVVMQGFPGTFSDRAGVRTTGNPVRAEITETAPPSERFVGREQHALRLLVLGGSQGSRALNLMVPRALRRLGQPAIEVLHQAGPRHLEDTRDAYRGEGLTSARVEAFIEDMAAAYTWADLVVCRAGALTIAELCAVGIASILVPYPHAVDDHQTANARHLKDAGCALLLQESVLTEELLARHLGELLGDRSRLLDMASRCRGFGRPDATRLVGDMCMEVAGG